MIKTYSKVKSNLRGLAALKKKMKSITQYSAQAGYYDNKHPTAGISYAYLASIHEYGTRDGRIPQRDFITRAYLDWATSIKDDAEKAARDIIYRGVPVRTALKKIADEGAVFITNAAYSFDSPANAASTIRKKGFDNPLIETGKLANGVKTKVVKKKVGVGLGG